MLTKRKLLQLLLMLGAVYYIVGAIVHFFGLTLFPFYDHALYSPYHDMLLALASFVLGLFVATVAKDPLQNKDALNVVIVGVILASVFSILIVWRIDFVALGSTLKKTQTLFEGIVGLIYAGALLWLYPK